MSEESQEDHPTTDLMAAEMIPMIHWLQIYVTATVDDYYKYREWSRRPPLCNLSNTIGTDDYVRINALGPHLQPSRHWLQLQFLMIHPYINKES